MKIRALKMVGVGLPFALTTAACSRLDVTPVTRLCSAVPSGTAVFAASAMLTPESSEENGGEVSVTNHEVHAAAYTWARQDGGAGPADTHNAASTSDAYGNVFVAGITAGKLDGVGPGYAYNGTVMQIYLSKYDSAENLLWTKQLPGATVATASAVATDLQGSVYVTGWGSQIGGTPALGTSDVFVAKYDTNGTQIWIKSFGATGAVSSASTALAVDSLGNLLVTGYTTGAFANSAAIGTTDMFAIKIDGTTGNKIWATQYGEASKGAQGVAVAVDVDNCFYVATKLSPSTLTSSVRAYSRDGNLQWVDSVPGIVTDIGIDAQSNLYLTGATSGAMYGSPSVGSPDYFLSKFKFARVRQWTRTRGVASKATFAQSLAVNALGQVAVAGYSDGDISGDGKVGTQDFFVSFYDVSGTLRWIHQRGAAGVDTQAFRVSLRPNREVVVTGSTYGALAPNTLTGSRDYFMAFYDDAGTLNPLVQVGARGPINTFAYGVATDASANVYGVGSVEGALTGATQVGKQDAYLVKFNAAGTKQWTRQFGTSAINTIARAVQVGTGGTSLAVAGYRGPLNGNTSEYNYLLNKYDNAGTLTWSRDAGVTTKTTMAMALASDGSDNLYAVGNTAGALHGGTLVGTQDYFLTKYNSGGTLVWARQLGVATKSSGAWGAAVDTSGNVYVAGYSEGNIDSQTLTGTRDLMVAKYNSSGTIQWTRLLGSATKSSEATAAVVDASGNLYVSGRTTGSLGGNTISGSTDMVVAKYNTAGALQWVYQAGQAGKGAVAASIALDSDGDLLVSGNSSATLGGVTVTGTGDAFLMKLTNAGVVVSTQLTGVAGKSSTAAGAAAVSNTAVYTFGQTNGGVAGTLVGRQDYLLLKYPND